MKRKPSEKQKAILDFLLDGDKKKSEITENFKNWYYANAAHHIGQILNRMIKADLIVRVRRGVYGRATAHKEKCRSVIKNQMELF